MRARALRLHALVRLGETGRAEQDIADSGEQGLASGDIRLALAALRIAQDDPRAATAALAPVLSGATPVPPDDLASARLAAGGDRPGRTR